MSDANCSHFVHGCCKSKDLQTTVLSQFVVLCRHFCGVEGVITCSLFAPDVRTNVCWHTITMNTGINMALSWYILAYTYIAEFIAMQLKTTVYVYIILLNRNNFISQLDR